MPNKLHTHGWGLNSDWAAEDEFVIAGRADGEFVFANLYKAVATIEPLSAMVLAPDPNPEPPTGAG